MTPGMDGCPLVYTRQIRTANTITVNVIIFLLE